MREVILLNAAECKKCHDVIESTHVHDFVSCACGAISVDGGKDYLRRSYDDITNFIERSQVEYHPLAVWLYNRVLIRLGDKKEAIKSVIFDALKWEATSHIIGALNDLPSFAKLSFPERDEIRKTIQRELTGEYK